MVSTSQLTSKTHYDLRSEQMIHLIEGENLDISVVFCKQRGFSYTSGFVDESMNSPSQIRTYTRTHTHAHALHVPWWDALVVDSHIRFTKCFKTYIIVTQTPYRGANAIRCLCNNDRCFQTFGKYHTTFVLCSI